MRSALRLTLVALTIAACPMLSFGQGASGEHSPSKRARFPASRTTFEGQLWLSWDTPVRGWFVEAALAGYRVGYDQGCRDAVASQNPRGSEKDQAEAGLCPNRELFSSEALHYSRQMTDFYNRYPEDQDLPLAYLVEMLIGPKPKTLEEIHLWVSSIGR